MLIDNCPHSFEELTATVLPMRLANLKEALHKPHSASLFCAAAKGPVSIARELGLQRDFSGCYVLVAKTKPIYVGISRSVLSRLRQHFTGKTHFDASLVYAMAQRGLPTKGKRADAMQVTAFQQEFSKAQSFLRSLHVAFIEIENPLELYVFEAYAAVKLCTHEWNTFRTH
ncbi:MAG: GIY-YIG nuclease family protein [Pseudomonadota bacterium]